MRRAIWIGILASAALGGALLLWWTAGAETAVPIRIGFSVGGRTVVLLWAHEKGRFRSAGLDVTLLAEGAENGRFVPVPMRKKRDETFKSARKRAERITGAQLIDRMLQGEFDGVTVGGAPFLEAIAQGKPILAVAGLGHERADHPSGGLVLRKGLLPRTPADLKGKVLVAKQTGAGHGLVLREFLLQVHLDPDKDVVLEERVPEEQAKRGLLDGTYDGGYFNLGDIREFIREGRAHVYRPLDWLNPELLQSYLVFRKDFVERHPALMKRLLHVYCKQILRSKIKLRRVSGDETDRPSDDPLTREMGFPEVDSPPLVRLDRLEGWQALLLKHGYVRQRTELAPHVDNRFVSEAAADLESSED